MTFITPWPRTSTRFPFYHIGRNPMLFTRSTNPLLIMPAGTYCTRGTTRARGALLMDKECIGTQQMPHILYYLTQDPLS